MVNIKKIGVYYPEFLKIFVLIFIFIAVFIPRFQLLHQDGKDFGTYIEAVEDFLNNKNPYIATVETYQHLVSDPGNKGYAYLPGFLYTYSLIYAVVINIHGPQCIFNKECADLVNILWKIPTYLADLGIGILIVKSMYKKSYIATIFALLIWYLNPYFIYKGNYITNDPVTIFFLLASLYYLKKDEVLSGSLYFLAIVFKTFPVILLPIYLLNMKDSKALIRFLTAGFIIIFAVSRPFMRSFHDFYTYIQGSFLVHSERFIQGRPYLFYISYYYKVELFQIIPFKVYTLLATFSGWAVTTLIMLIFSYDEEFSLSIIPFLTFYLFTPVLNTTYVIWFLPIFLIGLFNFDKTKNRYIYYSITILWYIFIYWYLAQWKDGFHIWRPI